MDFRKKSHYARSFASTIIKDYQPIMKVPTHKEFANNCYTYKEMQSMCRWLRDKHTDTPPINSRKETLLFFLASYAEKMSHLR